jgi:hypothetical protein
VVANQAVRSDPRSGEAETLGRQTLESSLHKRRATSWTLRAFAGKVRCCHRISNPKQHDEHSQLAEPERGQTPQPGVGQPCGDRTGSRLGDWLSYWLGYHYKPGKAVVSSLNMMISAAKLQPEYDARRHVPPLRRAGKEAHQV